MSTRSGTVARVGRTWIAVVGASRPVPFVDDRAATIAIASGRRLAIRRVARVRNASTSARGTDVVRRATIAVITSSSIHHGWIAALSGRRIASACRVALVGRRADDRIRASTRSALANIRLRTRITIITRRRIVYVNATAGRIARIVRTAIAIAARDRIEHTRARHEITRIRRARIAVVALAIGKTARNAIKLVGPDVRRSASTIDRSRRTGTSLIVVIDRNRRNHRTMRFEHGSLAPADEVQIARQNVGELHRRRRVAQAVATRRRPPLRKRLICRQSPNTNRGRCCAVQNVVVRSRRSPTRRRNRIDVTDCIMLPGTTRSRIVEDIVEDAHGRRNRRCGRVVASQKRMTRQRTRHRRSTNVHRVVMDVQQIRGRVVHDPHEFRIRVRRGITD